jgi:hypothetical protein
MKRLNLWPLLPWLFCMLFWLWVVSCIACKPDLIDPAYLVVQKIHADSLADGTICVYGEVVNTGALTAYNGRLHTIVNDGEAEYILHIGNFRAGQLKPFEQPLYGYCDPDAVKCHFETRWNHEMVAVSMDSECLSEGD